MSITRIPSPLLGFTLLLILPLAAPATAQSPAAEPVAESTADPEAVDILLRAADGEIPALRSNALEAMQALPDRVRPLTERALDDPNPGVRFAAVVTAGMMRFEDLAPHIRPRLNDENPSVQAAAIFSLHTLGERINLTPLADMLTSQDPGLRGNVALLLGLLGDRSAVPMLKRAATAPMPRVSAARAAVARIQVAEAIAKLGDNSALDALRAGAYSQFGEVRVLSITAMGAVGDHRMELALEQLLADPPVELQLAAAAALARLGNQTGLEVILEQADHDNPVVRSQAAWSLGWFDGETSMKTLRSMMEDPEAIVRVSAAASVLRRTAESPSRIGAAAGTISPEEVDSAMAAR